MAKSEMNKYRNKKTEVDGMVFDSQKEAARYQQLKLLERAGEIKHLEIQPKFMLVPAFQYGSEFIRPVYYIADFAYLENDHYIVEDVKGYKTKEYQVKRKMLLYKFMRGILRKVGDDVKNWNPIFLEVTHV